MAEQRQKLKEKEVNYSHFTVSARQVVLHGGEGWASQDHFS